MSGYGTSDDRPPEEAAWQDHAAASLVVPMDHGGGGDDDATQPVATWAVTLFAFGLICFPTTADFVLTYQLNTLGARLGIPPADGARMSVLATAAGFVFTSRLLGRALHSVVLGWLQPRARCAAGALTILSGVLILFGVYFSADEPHTTSLVWFVLSALFTGFGNGVLVANGASYIGTYGASTKAALGVGFTAGWCVPGVVVFAAQAMSDDPNRNFGLVSGLLLAIAAGLAMTLVAMLWIEHRPDGVQHSFRTFVADGKHWRAWLPDILPAVVALFVCGGICMFVPTVAQLYYGAVSTATLLPGVQGSPKWGLCLGSALSVVAASAASRYYCRAPHHKQIAYAYGAAAMVCVFTTVPLLGLVAAAVLSMVCSAIEVAAGSVEVERRAHRLYSLTAVSVWLMALDLGGALGCSLGGVAATLLEGLRAQA
jgi:hypothetical protein